MARTRTERQPRRRFVIALAILLAGLTAANLRAARATGPHNPAEEAVAARGLIYLIVHGVEEYRDSTGLLPPSLEAVGLDEQGIEYRAKDTSYMLTANLTGGAIVYQNGQDLGAYRAALVNLIERTRQ
ncbi:MAG: hypothetical protein HKM89_14980 [Gemmatimonadales bacterium]|nr:hypothetical protein [Gemmatimonadales bacterium]